MENKLTQKEINKIIENHKHWLNKDVDGWDNMKADFSNQELSYANLRGVDLRGAELRSVNLSCADISGANLSNANLSGADLSYANLSDASFCGADLSGAYLSGVDLSEANLSGADLSDVDLSYANLSEANLSDASLCDADLSYTNLSNANLRGANLHGAYLHGAGLLGTKNMMYIPMACPEKGSFIGFKKAVYADKDYIVKLEILADALRSSAESTKCRCNKAKVLEIQNIDGSKANIDVVHSICDPSFQYKTGQIVEEPKYDNNRFNECSKGIYFFINRQEAVEY
jgi:uncharacterized protein YjbI with pentapeptide repeats